MNVNKILDGLDRFEISVIEHSQSTLVSHLKGTHKILRNWSCPDYVCLAGLCHSIYGTESFLKYPVNLENRKYVQDLIGLEAEQLVYLFGVHKKNSLWENIDRSENFVLVDRLSEAIFKITESDLANLITLTLANWLEQRPAAGIENQQLRKNEFLRSKKYLPISAYAEFLKAYEI